MKACILCGGEGRRLRPLTSFVPKPMLPVLGKPMLCHILERLAECGITEAALTLGYLPDAISEAFPSGEYAGIKLRFFTESRPLGTAGGVKACEEFLADGDFLVIAGDAMCELDLAKAMELHASRGADATVVLSRQENPLEYGLVSLGEDGRVLCFTEKPTWEKVFTDVCNTGIYVLSPRVFARIPSDVPFDFARGLFPALMRGGGRIFGVELGGYWRDIGDTESYLQCNLDALNGLVKADGGLPELVPGVYADRRAPIRSSVTLRAPVWIHPKAAIASGAVIGPNAVICEGAAVGEDCLVCDSMVSGTLERGCECDGAIVCAGATVGAGGRLCRGSVVGSGAALGENTHVSCGVRVYPDVKTPDGAVLRGTALAGKTDFFFEDGALLCPTPELACAVGGAAAALSPCRRVCVAHGPEPAAAALAHALASGAAAAGADVIMTDLRFASGASASAALTGCGLSLFADASGEAGRVWFFSRGGSVIGASEQRKAEGLVSRGEISRCPADDTGSISAVGGVGRLYSAYAAEGFDGGGAQVNVRGHHPAAEALKDVLTLAGFSLPQPPALSFDGLTLSVSRTGMAFSAEQNGLRCSEADSACLALIAALGSAPDKTVTLPPDAPAVCERLAERVGGRLSREGAPNAFTRDGVLAAVLLASFIALRGASLADMAALIPPYAAAVAEANAESRGAVMRRASEAYGSNEFSTPRGHVRITPMPSRRAVKIAVESFSAETAAALAEEIRQTLEKK